MKTGEFLKNNKHQRDLLMSHLYERGMIGIILCWTAISSYMWIEITMAIAKN
jgi:hypothetical protein